MPFSPENTPQPMNEQGTSGRADLRTLVEKLKKGDKLNPGAPLSPREFIHQRMVQLGAVPAESENDDLDDEEASSFSK